MKTLILALTALLLNIATESFAQEKDFALELSESVLQLKPGETKSIDIKIIRPKGYTKSRARMNFVSPAPAGISLRFEPADGIINTTRLTVTASKDAPVNSYMILPNCLMKNKSKSALLKLAIVKEDTITSEL